MICPGIITYGACKKEAGKGKSLSLAATDGSSRKAD